jgi:hypothetical protein
LKVNDVSDGRAILKAHFKTLELIEVYLIFIGVGQRALGDEHYYVAQGFCAVSIAAILKQKQLASLMGTRRDHLVKGGL